MFLGQTRWFLCQVIKHDTETIQLGGRLIQRDAALLKLDMALGLKNTVGARVTTGTIRKIQRRKKKKK